MKKTRKIIVAIIVILWLFVIAGTYARAEMKDRSETTCIIIHHSATDSGNVEAFRRFHIDVNGWSDIGYHFVIANGRGGPDGEIQKGRALEKQGAHAKGRNEKSVGVCLVGNAEFTQKQKESLTKLLATLCRQYKLSPSKETIQGHHEKCPGPGLNLLDVIEQAKKAMEEKAK